MLPWSSVLTNHHHSDVCKGEMLHGQKELGRKKGRKGRRMGMKEKERQIERKKEERKTRR